MTLAKVKPRVPAANGSWPRRPRKAVVMAILINHVKFMAINGRAIVLCNLSSERIMMVKSCEIHLGIEIEEGILNIVFGCWVFEFEGMSEEFECMMN